MRAVAGVSEKNAKGPGAKRTLNDQRDADAAECVRVEGDLIGWQLCDAPGARGFLPQLRTASVSFHAPHDRIIAAIAKALDEGDSPTAASIALRMRTDPGLPELGGKDYLLGLARSAPAIATEANGRAKMESDLRLHRALALNVQIAARPKPWSTQLLKAQRIKRSTPRSFTGFTWRPAAQFRNG
jgi:hypothetical protein